MRKLTIECIAFRNKNYHNSHVLFPKVFERTCHMVEIVIEVHTNALQIAGNNAALRTRNEDKTGHF